MCHYYPLIYSNSLIKCQQKQLTLFVVLFVKYLYLFRNDELINFEKLNNFLCKIQRFDYKKQKIY